MRTDQLLAYHCGLGGVSPRHVPVPASCPTAYKPWWEPAERFWEDRSQTIPRPGPRPPAVEA